MTELDKQKVMGDRMTVLEQISHETMIFMRGKYSKCGQRCDLCVHYIHTDEELRAMMEAPLSKMWGQTDWNMRCEGCYSDNCYCKDEPCNAKGCASEKKVAECRECTEFPCIKATSADYRSMIHTEIHYADEITWGILPYVPYQYEEQ